ncbi:ABC transporter substrate-binding protein [Streptomyces sp. NPDC051976]|uniref:ABC transporter substrate-binding protein n=1 Tax=Streptomyces sp. NPDC051976 TaxID=3154947 RepID=UPI00342FB70E
MNISKRLCAAAAAATLVALSGCSSVGNDSVSSAPSKAKGEPIKVGFLNQGSGALAFPDFAAGGIAGAHHVNAEGGINGRPIDLVTCDTDGTPAASVKCANQFVSEHVVAVVQGIDLNSDNALQILIGADIPLIGHAQFGVVQTNSADAFFFGAASGAYYGLPLVTLAKKYGAKHIAFLNVDTPTTRTLADANLDPVTKKLGIDLKKVFYPAMSPNYNAVFASAVSSKPDAVLIVASEADCTGLVQAGRALGYRGTIFAGSCSQFIAADPSAAEGVLTDTDMYLPDDTKGLPPATARQVADYQEAMKGQSAKNVTPFSQMTFSGMMDLATALKAIKGEIKPESLKKSLRSIHGVQSYMGQTISCDGKQWPYATAVCAPGLLAYKVVSGKRQLVSGEFTDVASYYKN